MIPDGPQFKCSPTSYRVTMITEQRTKHLKYHAAAAISRVRIDRTIPHRTHGQNHVENIQLHLYRSRLAHA